MHRINQDEENKRRKAAYDERLKKHLESEYGSRLAAAGRKRITTILRGEKR